MKVTFVECDFINHIYIKDLHDIPVHKTWEIASPVIFRELYTRLDNLTWNSITIENNAYKYTALPCNTSVGKGFVYILAKDPSMFHISIDSLNEKERVDLITIWWKQWAKKHIIITCPIIYNHHNDISGNKIHTWCSWTYFSKKRTYERSSSSSTNNNKHFYEQDVLRYFIESQCFTIASGQIYVLGLYRANYIHKYTLLRVLENWIEYTSYKWKLDTDDNNNQDTIDSDIDMYRWYIEYDSESEIETNIIPLYGLNTTLGDNPLLYLCYGNTSKKILEFMLQYTHSLDPLYLLVTQSSTNSPRFYYLSYYSVFFKHLSDKKWSCIMPYLSRMSIHQMYNNLNEHSIQTHIKLHHYIINGFQLKDDMNMNAYYNYIRSELHLSSKVYTQMLYSASFYIYSKKLYSKYHAYIPALWSFLRTKYFPLSINDSSDVKKKWQLQWEKHILRLFTNSIKSKRIYTIPPWKFLHWLFNINNSITNDLYHTPLFTSLKNSKQSDTTYINLYTLLKQFPEYSPPYLYRKHIIEKKICGIFHIIHHIKHTMDMGCGIGDALENHFLENKDAYL